MPLEHEFVDLALDDQDQIEIPMRHIAGREGVAQRIRIALRMVRGEWFRDRDRGIAYFPGDGIDPALVLLGNKFFDVALAEAQFRDAISRVPGVAQITALSVSFDGATRTLTVDWTVRVEFDDAPLEGTTEVNS